MVLSSQQRRASFTRMPRRHPGRRRRRANRGPLVLGGGVVILAALIVVLITGWPFGSTADPTNGDAQLTRTTAPADREVDRDRGRDTPRPDRVAMGPDRQQQQADRDRDQAPQRTRTDAPARQGNDEQHAETHQTVQVGTQAPGGEAVDRQAPVRRSASLQELRDQYRPVVRLPRDIRMGTASAPTAPDVADAMDRGLRQLRQGQVVQARLTLSRLLKEEGRRLSAPNAQRIRTELIEASEILLFSRDAHPDDPLTEMYRIQSGDVLERIAARYSVTPELLALVNGMNSPDDIIRVGDFIKVVRGPLHLEVDMSAYRLDVLADCPASGERVYISSFSVGVGQEGRETPAGSWVVSNKVKDPPWTDPDTRRQYQYGEQGHQIGSRWIALRGTDANTEGRRGIGIHGTIDPASIGRAASRGCIRMHNSDVEFVYDLVSVGRRGAEPSSVTIRQSR